MHIELTDHLRCPADHEEAYLVLLPDEVVQRSVWAGELGCPICHRIYQIRNGILDLGDGPSPPEPASDLDAESIVALTGLSGPGGYLALVGPVASQWRGVADALPGVQLVSINGPAEVTTAPGVSIIRSAVMPIKRNSMRGVVLSGASGNDAQWVAEAARVVLPGLRVVGQGEPPSVDGLDVVASAGGWWVAARRAR